MHPLTMAVACADAGTVWKQNAVAIEIAMTEILTDIRSLFENQKKIFEKRCEAGTVRCRLKGVK